MKKQIIISILILYSFLLNAEKFNPDSIIELCGKEKSDSLRFECLYMVNTINLFRNAQYEEALTLLNIAKDETFIKKVPSHNLRVISGIGTLNYTLGDNDKAIEYFTRSINIIDSFPELSIQRAGMIGKLAVVYSEMGLAEKAKKMYKESLDKLLETRDSMSLDYSCYYNLGAEYLNQDSTERAKPYFDIALKIAHNKKDSVAQQHCVTAISTVFMRRKEYEKARKYADQSIRISLALGDSLAYANALITIGDILEGQNYVGESINYVNEALEIFRRYKRINRVIEILKSTAKSLYEEQYYQKAAEYYKEYIQLKDSSNVSEINSKLAEFEAKYETEKKESQIKLLEKEGEVKEAQKERQKIISLAVSFGMVIAITFLIFVYNRLKITKKQKEIIEDQKKKVEEQSGELEKKNEQITDSIYYASKIQNAVIPTEKQVKMNFKDAFVFYHPKDIVSGDFYWQQVLDDKILIAVADCTGHGVPGAFMSMVGTSLLDKIVLELGITSPELIMDQLNKDLYERLHVSEQAEVKDGMDLFVACIDKDNLKLTSSGAYNPMYIVKGNELIEFKGDKLHLGNLEHTKGKSYTLHELELDRGDCIYMFTDGFPDQKGGDDGKKFFYPPFRKLLLEIADKEMHQQKQILYKTYTGWKGKRIQMDDVCVLGFRV